jgi:hypothetical protein
MNDVQKRIIESPGDARQVMMLEHKQGSAARNRHPPGSRLGGVTCLVDGGLTCSNGNKMAELDEVRSYSN